MRWATSGLLLLIFCATSAAAGQRTIAWRLDEGQALRVRLVQTTRTQMQVADKTTAISLLAAIEMRWCVQRVDADGTLHVKQTFTRLFLRSTAAEADPLTFDSASGEPPPPELREVAASLRPLLASRFVVAIGPRGEIVSVQPTAETESLLREVPAYAVWKNLLTPAGINRTLRHALGLLPEGPVKPGDCWRQSEQIDAPGGPLRIASTYCYQETAEIDGRPLEIITQTAEIGAAQPPGAFDPPRQGDPTQRGTYRFDARAGHLVHSQVVQTITTDSPLAELPVHVTVTSTLVTSIVAVEDGG